MKKSIKLVSVLSASALMAIGMSSMAFAATGWTMENGEWHYYKSNGDEVQDDWKKSGDNWYWLDSDGKMATDSFIEDDGNYYYVNGDGVMLMNQWKYIDTDYTDDGPGWYYFGSNGKALKQTGDKAKLHEIAGRKYIFNADGVMQYGWIDENGVGHDEEDSEAWRDAVYYAGTESEGWLATGWQALDVDTDDDDYQGYYWFYFNPANNKKIVDNDGRNIDGVRYGFDEDGVMLYEFSNVSNVATPANASDGYKYYQDYDNGVNKRNGWFKAVPDENINPQGYDDGIEKWFYANSNGTLKANTLTSINGKKYAFDEYGEMLSGLRGLKVEGTTITGYTDEIEAEDDLDLVEGTDYVVYYFGNENDGAMKKNSITINLDDATYRYEFKSDGAGRDGIYKDCIYVKGRRIEADTDKGYVMVDVDGVLNNNLGEAYLINTSGKIQKKKTNIKDKDDYYYCTDADGIVIYKDVEKYKK